MFFKSFGQASKALHLWSSLKSEEVKKEKNNERKAKDAFWFLNMNNEKSSPYIFSPFWRENTGDNIIYFTFSLYFPPLSKINKVSLYVNRTLKWTSPSRSENRERPKLTKCFQAQRPYFFPFLLGLRKNDKPSPPVSLRYGIVLSDNGNWESCKAEKQKFFTTMQMLRHSTSYYRNSLITTTPMFLILSSITLFSVPDSASPFFINNV